MGAYLSTAHKHGGKIAAMLSRPGAQPGDREGLDLLTSFVLLTPPSLRSDKALRTPLTARSKDAALARPKGGDMVDIRGLLFSIVMGLGFWAVISVSLSLLIQ